MENILQFAESFPPALQWLGIILISAIPFVESYLGAFLGIITGVPAPIAVIAAVVGNVACMLVLVLIADASRKRTLAAVRARRQSAAAHQPAGAVGTQAAGFPAAPSGTAPSHPAGQDSGSGTPQDGVLDVDSLSPKKQKFKRAFDRFGVAGVSLFGQLILPSQITSALMVGFGASRNLVIIWQIVGITLWAGLFALLALGGVNMLER